MIFAEEDRDWVENHLIAHLEEQTGLKLCVHIKDFILGVPIMTNVIECPVASHKVIVIVTESLGHSYWCTF